MAEFFWWRLFTNIFCKYMEDTWTIVAEFCDIKERGRLYNAIKISFVNWETLIFHHLQKNVQLYILKGCLKGDWHCLKSHCVLKGYTMPYRTLSLPSGKTVTCWSPWCEHQALQINDSHIRVFFNLCNKEHINFIKWLHNMCNKSQSCSMVAHTPRRNNVRMWGVDGQYELQTLPHSTFRVKLYIYARLSGFPTLKIQYFESKIN